MRKRSRYINRTDYNVVFILLTVISAVCAFQSLKLLAMKVRADNELIWPINPDARVIEVDKPIPVYGNDMDSWVGKYVDKYFSGPRRSEVRMILHCLLHRESGHGGSNAHGDGGLAGGPLQFWDDTYKRMRGIMIKNKETTEMKSRYDMEAAIETAVYAIHKGWGLEWGPISRDANGSDFATCQKPSWYR